MNNHTLALRLRDHANNLAQHGGNLYRIRAYRLAAQTLTSLPTPVTEMLASQDGAGLRQLPGLGEHLAFVVECLVRTGDFHSMSAAARQLAPGASVAELPGVGPRLAQLVFELHGIVATSHLTEALAAGQLTELPPRVQRSLERALARHKAQDLLAVSA